MPDAYEGAAVDVGLGCPGPDVAPVHAGPDATPGALTSTKLPAHVEGARKARHGSERSSALSSGSTKPSGGVSVSSLARESAGCVGGIADLLRRLWKNEAQAPTSRVSRAQVHLSMMGPIFVFMLALTWLVLTGQLDAFAHTKNVTMTGTIADFERVQHVRAFQGDITLVVPRALYASPPLWARRPMALRAQSPEGGVLMFALVADFDGIVSTFSEFQRLGLVTLPVSAADMLPKEAAVQVWHDVLWKSRNATTRAELPALAPAEFFPFNVTVLMANVIAAEIESQTGFKLPISDQQVVTVTGVMLVYPAEFYTTVVIASILLVLLNLIGATVNRRKETVFRTRAKWFVAVFTVSGNVTLVTLTAFSAFLNGIIDVTEPNAVILVDSVLFVCVFSEGMLASVLLIWRQLLFYRLFGHRRLRMVVGRHGMRWWSIKHVLIQAILWLGAVITYPAYRYNYQEEWLWTLHLACLWTSVPYFAVMFLWLLYKNRKVDFRFLDMRECFVLFLAFFGAVVFATWNFQENGQSGAHLIIPCFFSVLFMWILVYLWPAVFRVVLMNDVEYATRWRVNKHSRAMARDAGATMSASMSATPRSKASGTRDYEFGATGTVYDCAEGAREMPKFTGSMASLDIAASDVEDYDTTGDGRSEGGADVERVQPQAQVQPRRDADDVAVRLELDEGSSNTAPVMPWPVEPGPTGLRGGGTRGTRGETGELALDGAFGGGGGSDDSVLAAPFSEIPVLLVAHARVESSI